MIPRLSDVHGDGALLFRCCGGLLSRALAGLAACGADDLGVQSAGCGACGRPEPGAGLQGCAAAVAQVLRKLLSVRLLPLLLAAPVAMGAVCAVMQRCSAWPLQLLLIPLLLLAVFSEMPDCGAAPLRRASVPAFPLLLLLPLLMRLPVLLP